MEGDEKRKAPNPERARVPCQRTWLFPQGKQRLLKDWEQSDITKFVCGEEGVERETRERL
jgi:hypothetical protein